jgi:hypothetical protein
MLKLTEFTRSSHVLCFEGREDNAEFLFSYDRVVGVYVPGEGAYVPEQREIATRTTRRHVSAWLQELRGRRKEHYESVSLAQVRERAAKLFGVISASISPDRL